MVIDWNAYNEGKQASLVANSNTDLIANPYPLNSQSWYDWNYGWNSDIPWLNKIKGQMPELTVPSNKSKGGIK